MSHLDDLDALAARIADDTEPVKADEVCQMCSASGAWAWTASAGDKTSAETKWGTIKTNIAARTWDFKDQARVADEAADRAIAAIQSAVAAVATPLVQVGGVTPPPVQPERRTWLPMGAASGLHAEAIIRGRRLREAGSDLTESARRLLLNTHADAVPSVSDAAAEVLGVAQRDHAAWATANGKERLLDA